MGKDTGYSGILFVIGEKSDMLMLVVGLEKKKMQENGMLLAKNVDMMKIEQKETI